jgi:hypothetical protein
MRLIHDSSTRVLSQTVGTMAHGKNLGLYVEATSVLVAPLAFYHRHHVGAKLFEAYVSHEELGQHLQAFRSDG